VSIIKLEGVFVLFEEISREVIVIFPKFNIALPKKQKKINITQKQWLVACMFAT